MAPAAALKEKATRAHVFPYLKARGGCIVNVGSDDALRPQLNGSHYSASKRGGGLVQFTRIPLGGRLGDAVDDLVPVMVFLASDASRFITGQILPVNGLLGWVR